MSTPWIPAITPINDGDEVSAEVVNPILQQFTQRTQYLYDQFSEFNDKSVLVAYSLPIQPVNNPSNAIAQNDLVFYNNSGGTEGLALAQLAFLVDPTNQSGFTPANSAFVFGIVKDINAGGITADVYLNGMVELDSDIDDPTTGMVDSAEIDQSDPFLPGPFFLSRDEAGKITRNPGGVAVFIGYALNRRQFLLLPNVNELNQFFTTYKFNILDRAAGIPILSTGTWSVTNPDLTKVGWINVASAPSAIVALAPVGAQFFYNLPGLSNINADTGIIIADQTEQKELARALPPVPTSLTTLFVNGIAQLQVSDNEPNGLYLIDEIGIWWFSNVDGRQPWSSDTPANVTVTVNTSTDEIALTNHGFGLNDIVHFTTTGTLPAPFVVATNYFVVQLNIDNNHFKVSATIGGSPIDITTTGTGVQSIPQPYIWKNNKGTDELRPRMSLQFIKFNPSLTSSLVTSLTKYNPSSEAISFWIPDKTVESAAGHGDLLARLLLNYTNGTPVVSAGTAISSLTYNETTGITTVTNAPIISVLTPGDGISIVPTTTLGQAVPGSYIISSTTNGASGRVSSLEPDGAELIYVGLHSYVSMTTPDVVPSSIIGKITLTNNVPSADMTFVMWLVGVETLSATKAVSFDFSYAVSVAGQIVNTASTTTNISFNMPAPYTAKTVFKVGGDGIAIPGMTIPAAAFGHDCSVNFQLSRTTPGSNPLTSAIGLIDIYWKIGV